MGDVGGHLAHPFNQPFEAGERGVDAAPDPREVAPADVHVVAAGKALQTELALDVSEKLGAAGVRVLVDDRAGVSPGVKFTDAELIGVPQILVAGRRSAEGVVELLANGSGFVRLAPPEPTDDDIYISAAQVKRCELVSGDRVSGPVRAPRRSERFQSLVRVDTINGRPADEVAEGTRFEDLPAAFPAERFELGSDDPTVKAIEWLTPFGKGSRVVIAGAARSGKSDINPRTASESFARTRDSSSLPTITKATIAAPASK